MAYFLDGVLPSNIKILVVEDVPEIFRSRKLAANGISIDYRITLDFMSAGYPNMTVAYDHLHEQLSRAVNSGNFTVELQENARRFNSSIFLHVVATPSQLRINELTSPGGGMPYPIAPLPIDGDSGYQQDDLREKAADQEKAEAAAQNLEDNTIISVASAVSVATLALIFYSVWLVRKRLRYMSLKSESHEDDAVSFRETEMLGLGSSSAAGSQEESVVWFNKEHDKSLA